MEKKEEGGVLEIFVENVLSGSAEIFRRGIFYSVINFGCRINLCFRGLCHDIPSKVVCLTVTKHSVEEPFSAVFQKFSGGEKV